MKVTRFAPSPSGRLHLGHAYSAVLGHHLARSSGGSFRLRIEDLDPGRCRPEFVGAIFEDLAWLGLDHDGQVLVQSERSHVYSAALEELKRRGLVYPCFCTRSDIAGAMSAPHGVPSGHYPGSCRHLADDPERRATSPHSWRLDAGKAIGIAGLPTWTEEGRGKRQASRGDIDDAILARKDAPSSYHLACVVDDAASRVSLVVRGADLASSTPIQRLLQMLLDLPDPAYFNHALVMHEDGRRLAKRDLAPTLDAMRESGVDGKSLRKRLLEGQLPLGFRLGEA
ncbi:MAG: tRNA glutamyl-Q(34) synthetase GluQRS [Sphingomonas sp.]|nr:tRNA glutamyl-Q(34) synthetase GluQRS [Sphingomonas sp.]